MPTKLATHKRILTASFLFLFLLLILSVGPVPEGNLANDKAVDGAGHPGVDKAPKPMPQSTPVVSDGFDFPVGTSGASPCPNDKGSTTCYWICRGFQDIVNNVCQKTGYGDHLGEDWNRGPLSNNSADFGEPIYAVSNGEVIFAQADVPIALSNKNWGKVIIIRHLLPDGTQVESQYGHVKDMLVNVGDVVTRGQLIATIGDGDGRWGSHLHFEIRYSNCPYWGAAGPAWSTTVTGWANPTQFINAHRSLTCAFTVGEGTSDSELTAFQNGNISAGGQALLGCPTTPVDTVGFSSLNGTNAHIQSFAAGQIQYLTNGSNAGQALTVSAPLHTKWISLGLDSNNPLGFATANRTGLVSTCFGTKRISQTFEGGSLEYHLTGARAESVFEVHGPIYAEWSQQGLAQCPLGLPISDVKNAPPSGASGNLGSVSDFEGGNIYLMNGAADAFALSGPINAHYSTLGGSASWLGFPTSDQYLSGNQPRVDFEGGYITTTDGTNYSAFPVGTPQGADLSIAIDALPNPVLLDENLTYSIVVSNGGPTDATGVTLTDVLPSNLTYVSATPSQGTCSGTTTVSCNLGSLTNGTSALIVLVGKPKTVGIVTNTATVRALQYDADALGAIPTGNNSATNATTVDPKIDLSITNNVTGTVDVGQNVTYTLVAKNNGPSPATGVTVVDQLPSSVTFVSASSTVGSCNEASGAVTCNIGNLAKNATATITLVGNTTVGGTIVNSASVSGNEEELITGNNTANKSSTVRMLISLTLTPATVTGCQDSVGKVSLNTQAGAGGATVTLSSSGPEVTVPSSVVIPAQTTNVSFPVTTTAVGGTQAVSITATLGPSSKTSNLTLKAIGVQSLTLSPNPVNGGNSVTGTITLQCQAGPADISVAVTSTNNSVAQVPPTVTLPVGTSSQDFTITTSNVTTTSSSSIKAAVAGTSSSVTLQVLAGNQAPTVNAGPDQTITFPADAALNGLVTDDGLPNPPAAVTTNWTVVSGPGVVTFGNASSLSTTASFSAIGSYVLRLTANDSLLSGSDDLNVLVNDGSVITGALSITGAASPATVNLTIEGLTDWAHWGLTNANSFNHRSGIAQQISNYTKIGSGGVNRVNANPVAYSWTNGTPVASATNTASGIWIAGIGKGFQITVPADTTDRIVKLYVGVWQAQGRLEASLSDSSATTQVDTTLINLAGSGVSVFTINFRAASAGQQLRLRWTMLSGTGNITLQAATLN